MKLKTPLAMHHTHCTEALREFNKQMEPWSTQVPTLLWLVLAMSSTTARLDSSPTAFSLRISAELRFMEESSFFRAASPAQHSTAWHGTVPRKNVRIAPAHQTAWCKWWEWQLRTVPRDRYGKLRLRAGSLVCDLCAKGSAISVQSYGTNQSAPGRSGLRLAARSCCLRSSASAASFIF
jgi:hypothetical protein